MRTRACTRLQVSAALREVAASLSDAASASGHAAVACAERFALLSGAAETGGFVALAPALGGAMAAIRRALASREARIVSAAGELCASLCAAACIAAAGGWQPAGAPEGWVAELMLGGVLKVLGAGDRTRHAAAARVCSAAVAAMRSSVPKVGAARAAVAAAWRALCAAVGAGGVSPALGEIFLPMAECAKAMADVGDVGADVHRDVLLQAAPTAAEVTLTAARALETLRAGDWHARAMAADFLCALIEAVTASRAQGDVVDSATGDDVPHALAARALAGARRSIAEGLAMAKYDKIANVRRAASDALAALAAVSEATEAVPVAPGVTAQPVGLEEVETAHRAARTARAALRPAHIVRSEQAAARQRAARQRAEWLRREEARELSLQAMRRARASSTRYEPTIEVLALSPPRRPPPPAITGATQMKTAEAADYMEARVDAAVERAAAEAAEIVRSLTVGAAPPDNPAPTPSLANAVAAQFSGAVESIDTAGAASPSLAAESRDSEPSDVVPDSEGPADSASAGGGAEADAAESSMAAASAPPAPQVAAGNFMMVTNPAFEDETTTGGEKGALRSPYVALDVAADTLDAPSTSGVIQDEGTGDELGFLVESLASARRTQIAARRQTLAAAEERDLRAAAQVEHAAVEARLERDLEASRVAHERAVEVDYQRFVASVLPRVREMLAAGGDLADAAAAAAAAAEPNAEAMASPPMVIAQVAETAGTGHAATVPVSPSSATTAPAASPVAIPALSPVATADLAAASDLPPSETPAPASASKAASTHLSDNEFMDKLRGVLQRPRGGSGASDCAPSTPQEEAEMPHGEADMPPSALASERGETTDSPPLAAAWTIPASPSLGALSAAASVAPARAARASPSLGAASAAGGPPTTGSPLRSVSLRVGLPSAADGDTTPDSPRAWFGSRAAQPLKHEPQMHAALPFGSPELAVDSGNGGAATPSLLGRPSRASEAPDLEQVKLLLGGEVGDAAAGVQPERAGETQGAQIDVADLQAAPPAPPSPGTPDAEAAMLLGMLSEAQGSFSLPMTDSEAQDVVPAVEAPAAEALPPVVPTLVAQELPTQPALEAMGLSNADHASPTSSGRGGAVVQEQRRTSPERDEVANMWLGNRAATGLNLPASFED